MNKFANLCAALVAACLLIACGSGGSNSGTDPVQPGVVAAVPMAPPADLVFVNVPTDTRKTSVIPGERAEIAAFRVEGINTPIEQLIFTNTAETTSALSTLFKRVRLFSNTGNDVGAEAYYAVSLDDKKGTITLDFSNQWVPVDSGIASVPGTYSLIADIRTDAKLTSFRLELTGAQTHAYGKTVDVEVTGGAFTVKLVPGMELPVVTTASPASFMTTSELGSGPVEMGNFKISCHEKNDAPCVLEMISFRTCNMGNPRVSTTDGNSWWSGYGYSPEGYYAATISGMEYSIKQGETKTFTVSATPYDKNLRLNVADMVLNVGDSTRVSAPISPTSLAGGIVEVETKECPNTNDGKG